MKFDRIVIVGTGLLGASLGLALKQRGLSGEVIGVARRQVPLDESIAMGCFDRGELGFDCQNWDADLVVLCTPVRTIIDQLEQLRTVVRTNGKRMLITDVGSTKLTIDKAGTQLINAPNVFIGSHPMAGGEAQGPSTARADLFDERPVVLIEDAGTDTEAMNDLKSLWEALGMKVIKMTASAHDHAVAAISHTPHAAAVGLVELASAHDALSVASTGFKSQSRLAEGDERLWTDIFLENQGPVVIGLRELAEKMNALADLIESGNEADLRQRLKDAKNIRKTWRETLGPSGD